MYQTKGMYETKIVNLSFSSKTWSLFMSRLTHFMKFIDSETFNSFLFKALNIHLTSSTQISKKPILASISFNPNENILIWYKKEK
ncbi:MAG: hypothetical protein LBF15_03065 [Candidatus Peribacteria bacterium]|jgi:hypothetical protein|nr:hypothetical protein [Candidatus Peribacteria bacterium]